VRRLAIVLALALACCGKTRMERSCEMLEERVITMSSGIAAELEKYKPAEERTDIETMKRLMRARLDEGTFMQECLKLDPEEVDCLASARTKEEWVACGFDQVMLP